MGRRKFPDEQTIRKAFKAHLAFVSVMTLGTSIRILIDNTDRNTAIFAIVLAFGVTLGLSILNKIIIDFCNDLNHRWPIVNYCVPTMLFGLLVVVARVPIDLSDIFFAAGIMLVANLLLYSITRTSRQTNGQ